MNKETNIIDRTLQALEQRTGIKGTWHHVKGDYDGTIDLTIKDQKISFFVEAKKDFRLYHLNRILEMADFHQPFMVVAESMAAPLKDKLRAKRISYLEASGNAFIDYDSITIFIDGNKPVRDVKPVTNRAFTKTGLKAVFHLLNDPQAITRTYRQLAEETGIALGNIKYIIDGLDEAGFILPIDKKQVALKNKPALLERWLTGYRETLKPDLLRGTYKIWTSEKREHWHLADAKALNFIWGGEAAAEIMTDYLQAGKLTIYTSEYTGKLLNGLGLVPDNNGNVLVYEKFWKQDEHDDRLAPTLLVYADLLITDDPRCIETANLIYKKKLRMNFETD